MRRSREAAAETRDSIVSLAARQFRKLGIDGIGIADLMAQAGLTHGGFYKHFSSKDALIGEACRSALSRGQKKLAAVAATAGRDQRAAAIVKSYLTARHRDYPERGCAIAALGVEAARHGGPAKHAVTAGYEGFVELVAAQLDGLTETEARRRAVAAVTAMIGALAVSRMLSDGRLSDEVLQTMRDQIVANLTGQLSNARSGGRAAPAARRSRRR